MLSNLCLIFLILTGYILVCNLALFIFAKFYGVIVEKFYIFFDPWFSLFKIKIQGTEFGLGWLPMGGYLENGSMEMVEDSEPQTGDFAYLPIIKQVIILFVGPFTSLLLALNCASSYLSISGLSEVFLYTFLITSAFFFYFKIAPKIIKNKPLILTNLQRLGMVISITVLYLIILLSMVYVVNRYVGFFERTYSFLTGDVKFRDILPHLSFHQKVVFSTYLGIWFFIGNLLPLAGMNGYHILLSMYESLVGSKLSQQLAERLTTLGSLVFFIFFGKLLYEFFF